MGSPSLEKQIGALSLLVVVFPCRAILLLLLILIILILILILILALILYYAILIPSHYEYYTTADISRLIHEFTDLLDSLICLLVVHHYHHYHYYQ